jgi:hypothetical protein
MMIQMVDLDTSINNKIGDTRSDEDCFANFPDMPKLPVDIFVKEPTADPVEDSMPEADEHYSPEAYDQYLTASVLMDRGGDTMLGTVKCRKRDSDGNPVGRSNMNLILDTTEYEMVFPAGAIDILTANTIAESLYSQVNEEGRSYLVLSKIIDHRNDGNAVASDDAKIPGTDHLRRTTKGWQLLVEWKDHSSDWIPLADLKNSYPVQVAEHAVNNKIATEPAFAWWVPHVLKKRDRTMQKVKTRFRKCTHKFGIEVPSTVRKAVDIDERTGQICGARQLRRRYAM